MVAKLTRLTHKIAIQLHLVAERAVLFSVLAPCGQYGNFWIYIPTFKIFRSERDDVCFWMKWNEEEICSSLWSTTEILRRNIWLC